MRKLKILHLSSERTWRGGEQQIANLIGGLIEKGHEVYVACKKKSAFEKYCEQNKINYISVAFANEFDFITAMRIKSFCKEFKIDILHAHSGHSHAIGVWSKILNNPSGFIVSRRVDFPIRKNWFSKFKYNYKGISAYICVSDEIKRVLSADLKNPEKCITVHSGIDLVRFKDSKDNGILRKQYNIPPGFKIVANISAIAPHKDYNTFVDTAEQCVAKNSNMIFLIIGDGPDREKIEQYVRSKGLKQHIIFTGFIPHVEDIICELDVLLITSKTEGLGTTILDAFANNIPVVATSGGGISELVSDHETGLLAEVGSSKQLSEKLDLLFKDENLRMKITKNAKNRLFQEFTKERVVVGTLEVYRSIIF